MRRALRRRLLRSQRGQTMVEYLLVMFVVVSAIVVVIGKLKQNEFFFKKFTEPLVKHITFNYKYGDPRAMGWDEGNPRLHIQIQEPEGQTFRMFQPDRN
jgi:Flp pilus assembly pilin Flp